MIYSNLVNNKNKINFAVIFIAILPLMSLLGSSIANSVIVIIDLIFLYEILKKKKFSFFKDQFFYGLIFLWTVLLINLLFFIINFENSFSRSFGFIRFILLVFAIKYYLFEHDRKFKNIILNSWLIIFL